MSPSSVPNFSPIRVRIRVLCKYFNNDNSGDKGGDYSMERNDGLNHGTERFLKLKLATYHC